uniref:Uncharacterized protein n=1 Tax=Arundo donax TaxID=35708 RepID=A0A0A9DHZ2_ARUDO
MEIGENPAYSLSTLAKPTSRMYFTSSCFWTNGCAANSSIGIHWHASISESCLVMSNESGRNRHTKNRSDLSKKALWLCLQMIMRYPHKQMSYFKINTEPLKHIATRE